MEKILYSLFLTLSISVFSQVKKQERPMEFISPFVVVDGMIATNSFITQNEKNIKSVYVYKQNAPLNENLKSFENFTKNGLISVLMKDNYYDKISLAELNQQNNLPKDASVYFDGNLITDTNLLILGEVIKDVEVKDKDGQKNLLIYSTEKIDLGVK